jgi:vancomycin resistance protein YoaR
VLILKNNEHFATLNSLNKNNNTVYKFCKKLQLYDKPTEHTLVLRNFRNEQSAKNSNIIDKLSKEIEGLQKNKVLSDVTKINDYKCKSHKKATKQIEMINKARQNIKNRNTVQLNVAYANQ